VAHPEDISYIRLHRKILESAMWKACDAKVVKGFLTMLLLANWKPGKWYADGQEIIIPRGSFVTTFKNLASDADLSLRSLRTVFHVLEQLGSISRKSTQKWTFITICNYNAYQVLPTRRATDNRHTTDIQPTLIEEVKEVKKEHLQPAAVVATAASPYQKPDWKKDPVKALVHVYKLVKGFPSEDRDWDTRNYPRCTRHAKSLLLTFNGSFVPAATCLEQLGKQFDQKGLTWTFETILKHCDEWKLRGGQYGHGNRQGVPGAQHERCGSEQAQGPRKVFSPGEVLAGVRGVPTLQPQAESDDRGSGDGNEKAMGGVPADPLEAEKDRGDRT
jgi:hypothetical protein